jgi:glycosyltransferase involved in cell wall biosynthesis
MALSVSVLIPNYNYGRYVERAIQSALAQTYSPLEVIVVDNGSTDNSRDVLNEIKDPRVKKIFQKNLGQSGSRNTLIRNAKGDLFAFLDADDVWLPTKLEKQIPLFERPEVVLAYCGIQRTDQSLQHLPEPPAMPKRRGRVLECFALDPAAVVCGGESTAVIRADAVRSIGEFDSELSISTGWDFWRRLAAKGEFDFYAESLVLYRQHGSNLSRRLDIYAHDTEKKLLRMFEDSSCQDIWRWKRRSFGIHRMALAGAFFQNYQPFWAIYWGIRAFLSDPLSLAKVVGWPLRFLRRKIA